MASYMTVQKTIVMKTFYYSGGSCVALERQYHEEYSGRVAPSSDSIYRIIKRFEETASTCGKHEKGNKRSSYVRTEEVGTVREAITRSTRKECDV
jgi:transposase